MNSVEWIAFWPGVATSRESNGSTVKLPRGDERRFGTSYTIEFKPRGTVYAWIVCTRSTTYVA